MIRRQFLLYLAYGVVSVDILVQEVKQKKWFKHVELEARHGQHFQKNFIYFKNQVYPRIIIFFSFINNILLLPIKNKSLIFLNC